MVYEYNTYCFFVCFFQCFMDEMDNSDTIITQVYSKGEALLEKTDGLLQVHTVHPRKRYQFESSLNFRQNPANCKWV